MTFLNAAELTSLRTEAERMFLTDTCTVQRAAETRDAYGAVSQVWTDVASLPCRVQVYPVRPREDLAGGQIVARQTYTVYLEAGADVLDTDRIRNGAGTLEVLAVRAPTTDEVVRSVVCRRV